MTAISECGCVPYLSSIGAHGAMGALNTVLPGSTLLVQLMAKNFFESSRDQSARTTQVVPHSPESSSSVTAGIARRRRSSVDLTVKSSEARPPLATMRFEKPLEYSALQLNEIIRKGVEVGDYKIPVFLSGNRCVYLYTGVWTTGVPLEVLQELRVNPETETSSDRRLNENYTFEIKKEGESYSLHLNWKV